MIREILKDMAQAERCKKFGKTKAKQKKAKEEKGGK